MQKESFLLHKGFWPPIQDLSDEHLGKLFRAIWEYQTEGKEECPPEVKIPFKFFLNQFKVDEEKYEKKVRANRENGARGGRPPKNPENPTEPKEPKKPTGFSENPKNPTEPKKADTVTGTVNDTVNGTVKYNEIVEMWNETCCPPLPKVEVLNQSRKSKIKLRLNEMGSYESIKSLFSKVKDTPFLKGDNPRGWQATFDWVFENEKNWVKVIEGNYDNQSDGFDKKNPNSQPKKWEIF